MSSRYTINDVLIVLEVNKLRAFRLGGPEEEQKYFLRADEAKKLGINEVIKELRTSLEKGLSPAEASKRLKAVGPNEIPEKKVNPVVRFLLHFWGPIPWMIEAAAAISIAINHWVDFYIIFSLLLTNALVGFWQEHKAENVIEYLKKKLSVMARVLREGKWIVMPAREVVPGDILRVRLGDIVPADMKLVEGEYLLVDESVLTGESLPVEKRVGDVVYSGSIVKRGEATGVAVATGLKTYFGKTVSLVEKARTLSKYQKMIISVGNYLIILTLFLVSITALVEYMRGTNLLELLRFSLVLTVAAIPAALPAVLSITMAIGAYELARKQGIVRKLVAIEEMASVSVLCADKTGTLTKNELTIKPPVTISKEFSDKDIVLYAALASREEDKDPIDLAVLGALKTYGLLDKYSEFKQVVFKPFDPVKKRTEAVVKGPDGESFAVAKGAPQVILKLVKADTELKRKVLVIVDEYAAKGYRMIGVARTSGGEGSNWIYVGLIPLFDPPREDAAETIKYLRERGINVKMITGDHVSIAREIAKVLGLGSRIYSIEQLKELPPEKATELALKADGFAEVYPEDKYKIVESLQSAGHSVAMTGDGVNDAPALKKANVGIAVSNATDAARAAASIVLLSPGISVIKEVLFTARKIFRRMYSYIIYRITETIRILFFVTSAMLVLRLYPITPLMLILLAFLNDLPILAIAYDNVRVSKKPERWDMDIILTLSTILGLLGVLSSFFILWISLTYLHLPLAAVQTFVFLKLAVAGHLTIFVTRTKGPFWSIAPGKLLLSLAVVTKAFATALAVMGLGLIYPLPPVFAAVIWGYAFAWFVTADALKIFVYRKYPTIRKALAEVSTERHKMFLRHF